MTALAVISGIVAILYLLINRSYSENWKTTKNPIPSEWRTLLIQKVAFYNSLSAEERSLFENKVQEFLLNCRITGIDTEVTTADRLLIASSAVIPIFGFPDWKYNDLFEILLYPNSFNSKFETSGKDRNILGMVGTGYMDGKMILSKNALHQGFANESDKKNTAIHEFIHLIDKADGTIDGVPKVLMDRQYAIPWLDLISKKIEDIHSGDSDINPYGGTNQQEFFSVAGEYFFERPKLLANKHPQLNELLSKVFNHDMQSRKLAKRQFSISRNSPCPCGSGKKFKHCCA